jgi:hypothetical protein
MNRLSGIAVVTFCFFWLLNVSQAEEGVSFEKEIKPILAENCFACHGIDEASRQADLRLDVRESAIDSGALVPGDSDSSSLVERLYEEDPEVIMPPPESHKKLSDDQKDLLKRWVDQGGEYTKHWALVAPQKQTIPAPKNADWVQNEIDSFVLSRLEQEGLSPAEPADATTLLRRITLDVTGLPPTPEEIESFKRDFFDRGDEAVSDLIDNLMQRPSWGEHRGRYWLDAARYADTHGMHYDNYREIWPYRDWVIKAFNKNQPFDQFTIEQLAGDLLENPTTEQLVATGFQRCNMTTNEGGTIDAENRAIYSADRVQTFGWVYLGLTTNCCQCHDHKFDPISMKDYYALAAYFRNTTEPAKDGNVKDGKSETIKVYSPEDRKKLEQLSTEIAAAKSNVDDYRKSSKLKFETWINTLSVDKPSDEANAVADGLVLRAALNDGAGGNLKSTGVLEWKEDGKIGPAAILKQGKTIELPPVPDFSFEKPFSYGAWINSPKKLGGAGIIAKMDVGKAHRGWDLYQQNDQIAAHIIDSWPNNAMKVVTKKPVLKYKQWQHVFVTYDGSRKPEGIRIYVDGVAQETVVESNTLKEKASLETKTPLRVGQRSSGAAFKEGMVQDVRVYETELSAAEVKSAGGDYIESLLSIGADERSEQQNLALQNHYLQNMDQEYPLLTSAVADLEKKKDKIERRTPITLIQKEKMNSTPMTAILMRGAYDKPGEEVTAAPPSALHPLPAGAPNNRLGLAKWVVDSNNPLTARVTVNRFWQELFGQGIVATSEDFGVMGTPPSNQELLDWLAVDFQESGWDVKRLFKKMLMSSTYRQAAIVTAENLEKDRDNSLLSRGPRFRMDAEMVRDYALHASGLLEDKMFGPGMRPYQPENLWEIVGLPGGDTRKYVQDKGEKLYRRSLYNFWKRMSPPPNLEAFNAPNREVCTVRRERTNTPLQALVTLNDPQFFEAARVLAQNAIKEGGGDQNATLNFIAARTVCRPFSQQEVAIIEDDLNAFQDFYLENRGDAEKVISVGEAPQDSSVDVAQLASWTMICNQLLNLDEVLTK